MYIYTHLTFRQGTSGVEDRFSDPEGTFVICNELILSVALVLRTAINELLLQG